MDTGRDGKLVILSAPSGAGKTTIMKRLREEFPGLEFSISATSRRPREGETHGVDYYFLTPDEFCAKISDGLFVEWEEVYPGTHYGTLASELERIWSKGHCIVFDVDVKGGLALKRIFGARALSVFIMPPSVKELERRLFERASDSPENIRKRVDKAETEIADAPFFDVIIINEELEKAVADTRRAVATFIGNSCG